MIPAGHITRWAKNAPWPTREQVEQDLVLSRLIAEYVAHAGFRGDLAALTEIPDDYDIDAAAVLITTELLARL